MYKDCNAIDTTCPVIMEVDSAPISSYMFDMCVAFSLYVVVIFNTFFKMVARVFPRITDSPFFPSGEVLDPPSNSNSIAVLET